MVKQRELNTIHNWNTWHRARRKLGDEMEVLHRRDTCQRQTQFIIN